MRLDKARVQAVALAAALAVGVAGSAAAQSVVVRSTGPSASSYPAGKTLTASDRITLQAQDSVTVLGKEGTRVLRGPGTFSLGDRSMAQATSTTRLASFISDRGARRARAGAFRGGVTEPSGPPTKPNIWYLDVRTNGNFCVVPGGVALWRPDYTGSASVDIVSPSTGAITKVTWSENDPLQPWPSASAPIEEGATYRLNSSGIPQERSVTFRLIPEPPEDEVDLTKALLADGCQAQVDELLALYKDGANGG